RPGLGHGQQPLPPHLRRPHGSRLRAQPAALPAADLPARHGRRAVRGDEGSLGADPRERPALGRLAPGLQILSTVQTAPVPFAVRTPRTSARLARWPLPALLVWLACAAVFGVLRAVEAPPLPAVAATLLCGALGSLAGSTPWRRVFIAAGVPLMLL